VMVLLVLAGVVIYPFVSPTGRIYLGSVIALHAIIALSLVVLTGWTGQVSLGQFGLAAVGAVVAGSLAARVGLPFWLSVPLACLATAAIAVLIGIPALRLPGLYLAVATFAFAAAVRSVLFDPALFGWLLPEGQVHRPALPFLSFENERAMYFLSLAALIVALVAVRNLRRSRFGRILIGLRDNEANAESAAVEPLRMKLTAFGFAGALTGFAGALLAFQQRGVSGSGFEAQASIDLFVLSVIGGIGSIFGPLVGSGVINGIGAALSGAPEVAAALAPSLAVVLLYLAPGGLISVAARVRDSVLRIVAQRNQMIVPSLFADIDPQSLHLRLIPISASHNGGVERLRRRYDLASMHADVREGDGLGGDAAALSAAARAAEEGGGVETPSGDAPV
ncbi:MAG: branched-chain amino acid ABC transporter permease, partial [Actinomycetota bacterium]